MEAKLLIELLLAIIVPGIGYLLLQSIQQAKMINAVKTQTEVLQNNVSMMNNKLDIFMRNEIDALKQIADSAVRSKK